MTVRPRALVCAALVALLALSHPRRCNAQLLALARDSAAMRLFELPHATAAPEPRVPRFDILRMSQYARYGGLIGAGVGFVGGEIAARNQHGFERFANVAYATFIGVGVGMVAGAATYVVREVY